MPSVSVPQGSTTVSVKVIDLTTISDVACRIQFNPVIDGIEKLRPSPALSFFIEHPSGRKLMFDLGIPGDISVLGEAIAQRLKTVSYNIVSNDPAHLLVEHGIPLTSIEAVIWSHVHWDHKGDMRTFPGSTKLIVGPGVIEHFIKGPGNSNLGGVNPVDIEGREVQEITFSDEPSGLKIGQFRAVDFFGDGSFYLLDSPGHEVGHMCGLARTTTSPDTFVLMAADVAHHPAEFRPSEYTRVPASILPNPVTGSHDHPFCCGTWFDDINVKRGRKPGKQLYDSRLIHYAEYHFATIDHLQQADADENILVLLAHDPSVRWVENMPFFPEPLNDWKSRGLGKSLHWSFIGDLQEQLKASGQPQIGS